jgi:Patatin-like phospholipase
VRWHRAGCRGKCYRHVQYRADVQNFIAGVTYFTSILNPHIVGYIPSISLVASLRISGKLMAQTACSLISLSQASEPDRECVPFKKVFQAELKDIQIRRAHLADAPTVRSKGTAQENGSIQASSANAVKDTLGSLSESGNFTSDEPVLDAVGLSLSGGGIRSAAFSLGVLQALDKADVLKRVDYLSTVSGGGYIGSSLSAGLSNYDGQFPFESKLDETETPSVKHIRNYSNYLIPHGPKDLLESLVIYIRGLVANAILVLPWLLFAAYVTIRSHPTSEHLQKGVLFRLPVPNVFPFQYFVASAYLSFILLAIFAIWTFIRSVNSEVGQPEVPSRLTTIYGYAFVFTAIVAFFELQLFILNEIWGNDWTAIITANIQNWLQRVAFVLAPLAGVAALFSRQLEALIKRGMDTPGSASKVAGYAAKAVVYLAAVPIPLFLWAVYFELSWWGIAKCTIGAEGCDPTEQYPQAPGWLAAAAGVLFGGRPYPMATFYLLCAAVLLFLSMLLSPNANSLHRLYRDRLSKAFLFKPQSQCTPYDPPALDRFKLTDLNPKFAPYHLINTALNIQGSRHVNRRGRNADFFMFSRRYIGSEATGYVSTKTMESVVPDLDLGTAMAVSAAAASSNMGAKSIRPLTPTLALLNVRVGFWLRNPTFLKVHKIKARLREFITLYFLYELIANLREDSWNVYVTDGGHLENLGAYELLKRRCRVIVVVDAGADPKMTFCSFIELQRYARIDLGVRINLPWQEIAEMTLMTSKELAEVGKAISRKGPHCAIGQIDYPDSGKGVMIYIKSSVTGDENDYIANYKKRYPLFPHESTADQFFTEEQFEVYRALGFHAAHGLFSRRDCFAGLHPQDFSIEALNLLELGPRITNKLEMK